MQRFCCKLPLFSKSLSTNRSLLTRNGLFYRDAYTFFRNSEQANVNQFKFQARMNHNTPVEDDPGKYKVATIPNGLCLLRIGSTPIIGSLVVSGQFTPAFALFIGAGLTDLLDGFIARNVKGQKSLLGSVLDPVADKLLVSVMFLTMTHAGLIPAALTSVVILRDVSLIVGGFYKRYRTMEPPYSLNRFFNPEVSSMQIVPTMISKINTVLQLCVVAFSLAGPVFEFGEAYQQAISILNWTTAGTTIYSGLQYASGRAFKKL